MAEDKTIEPTEVLTFWGIVYACIFDSTKLTSNKVVYRIVGWMGQMMYHTRVTIFLWYYSYWGNS
jgi:hypothetical protein